MRKVLALLGSLALVLGCAGVALAADTGTDQTGRVLVAVNGDIEVAAGQQADAVIVISGNARIGGSVTTLFIADGTASTESGATLGSLTVINGTADLASGTAVSGDISQVNSTVNRADGVQVGGSVRDLAGDVAAFGLFMGAAAILLWIGFALVTIVVGLLVAGLAARQVRLATTLISREPGRTFVVGLLAVVVPPILAGVAFLTVVGIPAALALLFILWPAAAFVGYMVAAIWIGEWLLGRRDPSAATTRRPYLAVVIGLVVAFLVGFIPLATAVISVFGLGAVVLAAWRTLRAGPAPAGFAEPQAAPVA